MKLVSLVMLLAVELSSVAALAAPDSLLALPDTRLTSGPSLQTKQTSATFSFSSSTAGVSFECSLDGQPYASCSSPTTFTALANGIHTILVRAVDSSGNRDDTPARYSWTVDTVPPTVQVLLPSNGEVVDTRTPLVRGTVDNPGSRVRVFINGQSAGESLADGAGNWTRVSPLELGNGPHTVNAEATDPAGNVGARSASISFTVDTDPPDTVVVEGPPRFHASRMAAFSFESPTGATAFECQLDAVPEFSPCAAEHLVTKLADGPHTLKVRAKDAAGNVDPTPAVHEWSVSVHAPSSPEISEPAEGAVVDTLTPLISGSAGPHGLVAVYVDDKKSGVVQADEGGHWSFRPATPLEEGEHKLTVEPGEGVGNSSELRSPVRSFSVSLGGCAASGSQPLLPLVGLGLLLLARRGRRA